MSTTLFHGGGWEIREETASLPDGRKKTVARGYTSDTVSILAFPTDHTVLVLREFRPFYSTYVWMLPSGKVDKEADQMVAARRELREETGYDAKNIQLYFSFRHAERIAYEVGIYIAKELHHSPLPQDDTELIEVHELPLEEAMTKLLSSTPIHSSSALALLRYLHDHPELSTANAQ